ncbi:PrsW family intramembrane metalloprotease [Schaalia odontolytica]|uniref:PrsW family intramembrane metalloprotease n=1 Tax=Schaalia odontolytica TaxID=1660 RepID=A0A857A6E5_9ACTO|nr:PrsW family intramembrane metalloprotease [Schaalia odontolytica]QGS10922.1 PrsW family intramembrane metalloprotease [Schaalia odontolytica]
MTHAVTIRPRSWALVACSLILIALSVRAALYELTEALEGISSSDAWLAVGASMLSAVVGLVFLAWAARLKPTMLSWLAAFGWGTGGALIFAGYGNTVIDSAVAASNLSDDAVDVVTSVVTGPLVEEIGKGIGVLALVLAARKVLDRPAQGGVLGALVGLGFAWGEDVGYYVSALEDGMSGLWQSFLARALLGAYGHAIFTGVFGYALAWAVLRAQNVLVGLLAAAGGFVAALALHAQANGIGFLAPEDSWNLTYGAIEIPVLVVSVALLVWGLRRHRSTLEA